jgi:hypothetical protein
VRALLLATGCTLLFDPSGLVPRRSDDLSQASGDLSGHVDDLRAPDDLAVPDLQPLDDLLPAADLVPVDLRPCTPPVFLGFFDGGSPDPLDCNGCGCQLDPLNDPTTWSVKFTHGAPVAGWSETFDGGVLTLAAPAAFSGDNDYFQSLNHFYLAGDFDLLVDYRAETLPVTGYVQLVVIGPPVDLGGSVLPVGVAQSYDTTNGFHFQLITDDRQFDVLTTQTSGTLRLRRTDGALCASSLGGDELCHKGTGGGHVWLQVATPVSCAAGCSATACCGVRVRLSQLRLLKGQVVSQP